MTSHAADIPGPEREPTLPADCSLVLRGWPSDDPEAARLFGERLMVITREYSRWLDLSRLSKIVLSCDYAAALAEFRDPDDMSVVVATSNQFGEGSAMSFLVAEEDGLRSVLVVWTPLISRIFDEEDTQERRTALQTYVHELVHVDDQAFLDRTYPGGGSAAVQSDDRHGSLLLMVSPAPTEYSATRRTAFIEPSSGFEFINMLEKVLVEATADVRRDRRRYRLGEIDLQTFWLLVQERGRFIFQALGYAVGHVDGALYSDLVPNEVKASLDTALKSIESMELGWLVEDTRAAVLPIFEQTAWAGLEIFDPLIAVGERLLNSFESGPGSSKKHCMSTSPSQVGVTFSK